MGSVLNWLIGWGSPPLKHGRVVLREPVEAHYSAWAELRRISREDLVPYEPAWSDDELTRGAYRRRLRRYRAQRRRGSGAAFFLFAGSSGPLVGGVTLTNIRYGVTLSASVGYWVGRPFVRRGFASDAVAAIVDHCYRDLELNRVEAACMPANRASIAVLERAGFRREGLARRYLKINGTFEDHLLFARLKDDVAELDRARGHRTPVAHEEERPMPVGHSAGRDGLDNGHRVEGRAS